MSRSPIMGEKTPLRSELERDDIDPSSRYAAAQLAVSVAEKLVDMAITHDALIPDDDEIGSFSR